MSFFGLNFGQNADIDIILDNQDERKMGEIKDENGRKERLPLFYDGESVTGKVNVTLHRKTNRLEHHGIKIEFIGQIELYYDRGNHHEFLSLVKELARPGELTQNTSFEFEFNQVEKPYECYTGANVRLRYFLRVTVVRRLTDMQKELDLLVHTLATYPEMNNPIKMEVGIEECLHIEFEYNKSKYHLKDVIVGKIYFLLVRIKIRYMEVAIIKRETTGSGPNTFHDNETIAKYEIMDGAPVKGESIPIRVFLAGYDLTPTMRDINKKFSVRYYLNLVLVDEEDRRYFKQQEITLWRKGDRVRKSLLLHQQGNPYHHQIPHAMARHNPGEFPSANVRTAPTPSEPNTPIAEPGSNYVPGIPSPHPPLPEEPLEQEIQDDDVAEPPHQEVTAAQQTPRQKFHSNSSDVIEEEDEEEEQQQEVEKPANKPSSTEAAEAAVVREQPQKPTNETNNHHVVESSPPSNDEKNDLMQSKTKGSSSANDPPPPLEKSAVIDDDSKKTSSSMSDSPITDSKTTPPQPQKVASEIVNTPSSPAEADKLTEKMSKLDTKTVSSSPSPPEPEETLFLPPEDDSVPDLDDSVSELDDAAAVVDNDEDEDDPIGDDDL